MVFSGPLAGEKFEIIGAGHGLSLLTSVFASIVFIDAKLTL